jgi:hypothetical protein
MLVSGIGRDGDFSAVEQFVCKLYSIPDQITVNSARLQLFSKAKKDLELLPPTHDALELHVARANEQAKIWLQADRECINIADDCLGWTKQDGIMKPVWTRLPAVPAACLELMTCGCKSKCRTARCRCFKISLQCTSACECNAVNCCNPVSYSS